MTSSSRHAAAPGLGLRTLLRRHLRDRAPLLLTGVMVAVLAGLLTAGSRAETRAADQALGVAIRAAEPGLRDISLSLRSEGMPFVEVGEKDDGEASAPFTVVDQAARGLMGPRVAALVGPVQVSAQSDYFAISRLTGERFADAPIAALRVQPGIGEQVTWVSGDHRARRRPRSRCAIGAGAAPSRSSRWRSHRILRPVSRWRWGTASGLTRMAPPMSRASRCAQFRCR